MSKELKTVDYFRACVQLVRLPNLLIIVLTQLLLRVCFLEPYLHADTTVVISGLPDFLALVFVTVLIAAGGYVINDYFDVKIDRINRPGMLVVNQVISRGAAIVLHMILTGIALLLGFYLAWRVKSVSFGLIFPLISGVLWIYSAKYKRVLFWGNFIVAALSSFVILIVWLFEFFWLRAHPVQFGAVHSGLYLASYVFLGYAIFAFMVSLVREIVKDLEDAEGDETEGCKTLPVVFGRKITRFIAGAVMLGTILLLAYAQVALYQRNLYIVFWYFMLAVQSGAVFFLFKLFRAKEKRDYRFLSQLCKLIMVTGILSMGIIYITN